jgi:hypothetical protein
LSLEFFGNGFDMFMSLGGVAVGDLMKTVPSLFKELG